MDAPRLKILAIDDDPSMLDIYEHGLAPMGHTVTCMPGPRQALKYLESNSADIILMDIMMPDQDGISLMRDIRSSAKTSHIPILAVSGLSDAATLNDALLFGASDYIVKPFEIDILETKIRHAMEAARKHPQKDHPGA